jgi:3-dehydroquinate synthase
MISRLTVKLGPRSYNIAIGFGLLDRSGPFLREAVDEKARNAVVVTNERINHLYGRAVLRSLKDAGFSATVVMTGDGERYKTLRTAQSIYDYLIAHRIERSDVLVALGGGVIGDITGFVAATYLRGIRYFQIPTTLLAQIDSSVGGKTGVNHPLGKNLIGAFHQPSVVLIDPETLASLSPRQYAAGLFEAVKYGVIRDRRLFDRIASQLEKIRGVQEDEVANLIHRCCAIKAEVVRLDEREGGLRRILNFGHTAGHALEAATRYRRFLHGEAVGLGMVIENLLSERLGLLKKTDRIAINTLIGRVGRIPSASTLAPDDIISALVRDKKTLAGRPTFVLPVEVGHVVIRSDVPLSAIKSALSDALSKRHH